MDLLIVLKTSLTSYRGMACTALAACVLFFLPFGEANGQVVGNPGLSPDVPTSKHEPIFGVGPRTIWKNGFGFELGLDREESALEESWGLEYHVLYGITADWAVSAETHQVLDTSGDHDTGVADLQVRTKYRFFRNDIPGGVFHSAFLAGAMLPTGTGGLSSETVDVIGGLSGAYEGRRWLAFLTGRYRVNTERPGGVRPGNVFLYDVALGLRPVKTGYYDPDVVLMGELNGQVFAERSVDGRAVAGSDGSRLLAGFGAWVTYRNWAVKPGVQLPLQNSVTGGDLDFRALLAVEFHI